MIERTTFSRVRAVLFDFDGTLVQQRVDFALMRRTVYDLARAYGVDPAPWSTGFILEAAAAMADHLGGEAGAEFAAAAKQAIIDVELAGASEARALPGVPAMLRELPARGYRVAIVTRNCRPAVLRVLAEQSLAFDLLLTRDDVAHVKPDPRHLQAALEQFGLSGAQALMVGDHPTDVQVGKAVSAATVGVLSPGEPETYFDAVQPDLVVASTASILDVLPGVVDD